MTARAFVTAAVVLLTAIAASAEERKPSITYSPVACIRGGELPLMQLNVVGEGELRGYFRRINTTDWCSVEGNNRGPLSNVVLPKFDMGDEVEYFFVLIRKNQIIARSARIYRAKVNQNCEMPFARHMMRLSLRCGDDAQAVPNSLGAGYALTEDLVDRDPEQSTPDRP
jgi:hypothetical protein